MSMKLSVVVLWLGSTASMLGGCAASDKMAASMENTMHGVADELPEWAGGPAQGLPPRPTDPGYAAYRQKIEGKTATLPTTNQPTSTKPNETPDHQPIGQ